MGLCTEVREECVWEEQIERCVFGWERTSWLFGGKYCVNQLKSEYNMR
jgi:hypothetical protein